MRNTDQWKKVKEAREKLNPDERRLKALEDIADELVMLRGVIHELPHQIKMHFPDKR